MARYTAIATLSEAIRGVLLDARGGRINPAVEVVRPNAFAAGPPGGPEGIAILLYRVGVGDRPRTLSAPRLITAAAPSPPQRLPPLPVDLHYLFVPWGQGATAEQRLLGWVMRTLEDISVLQAAMLNYYGGVDDFDEGESVALIPESFTMQDLEHAWELFGQQPRLSMGYLARMLYLDSNRTIQPGARVTVRELIMAQVE